MALRRSIEDGPTEASHAVGRQAVDLENHQFERYRRTSDSRAEVQMGRTELA